ncbi:hypothetical protein LB554_19620 [Mesorhizobium sp. CO1-1-11]|uniref:hypothetical protein n=1 Tax=Mesorhizobium sp. CO1-1-11 TaxID=2876636 RepID=UPI001CCF538E|nr:hypothetical protein [Mesorhizobium sp. CO1-1-11]MBZ9726154.1 hypothetical protein [Mesorhizobium sp. CO1-1-11]
MGADSYGVTFVRKQVIGGIKQGATVLDLRLGLEIPVSLRLDRLLANELGISRSRLRALDERRLLTIEPDGAKALRKPVREGATIRIDLASEPDRRTIISAAGG